MFETRVVGLACCPEYVVYMYVGSFPSTTYKLFPVYSIGNPIDEYVTHVFEAKFVSNPTHSSGESSHFVLHIFSDVTFEYVLLTKDVGAVTLLMYLYVRGYTWTY
jgi:hypothetical protein